MNIWRYLIGGHVESREEERLSLSGADKLTQQRVEVLLLAFDASNSLSKAGLAAMRIFGRDVPDDIGQEIKTAIENLRGTIAGYLGEQIDAAAMRAAVKEARAKTAKIRKALRALKK
jgi:ubiquinone biosynthesis protein UbiJ